MNFLARVAALALSPKQLSSFMETVKAEAYSNKSTVELWREWISEPTKRRAVALAEHPMVKGWAQSKVGAPLVGLGGKAIGAVKGTPAAAGSAVTKIGNIAESSVGPALLKGAESVQQVGDCACSFTFRQFAAQQIVCWGRHFKRAPSEAAELWNKVKTGTLTWSEVGAGSVQAGYIALWGITPYTLVSVTLANPALRLSDKEGGHH